MKKKSDYKIVCIIYSSLLLLLSRFSCVRPHRWQPTRLPSPWDSPGKHTGVGCHFLLQCMKVKSESKVAQSCPTLSNPMDCSLPGSSTHGIFQARVLEWGAIAFSSHARYPDSYYLHSLLLKSSNMGTALMISESLCMPILFQNDFYFCMDHNCTPVKADVGAIFFFVREKCET